MTQSQKTTDDLRLSRIFALTSGTPAHQLNRLEKLKTQFELGLARVAGSKLAPIIVSRMLDSLILSPSVLVHISGSTMSDLPTDSAGWDAFARQAILEEPLAQLCIDSRNQQKLEILRQTYVSGLPIAARISAARNGTLDADSAKYAESVIQNGAGL
jgi:hypothetical protein